MTDFKGSDFPVLYCGGKKIGGGPEGKKVFRVGTKAISRGGDLRKPGTKRLWEVIRGRASGWVAAGGALAKRRKGRTPRIGGGDKTSSQCVATREKKRCLSSGGVASRGKRDFHGFRGG